MTTDRRASEANWAAILAAHGVYLSDADEAVLIRRVVEANDVALLALRTCLCGARIDGFDEYWDHLREMFAQGG